MKPEPPAFLALLLAAVVIFAPGHLRAQDVNALDLTPSFKPTIKFTESLAESLAAENVVTTHHTAIKVVANIEGIQLADLNPSTHFTIDYGSFNLSRTLGDDPNYQPGRSTSAYFSLGTDALGRAVAGVGVSLAWTAKRLTITATLTPAVAENLPPGSAFVHNLRAELPTQFVASTSNLSFTFGTAFGFRQLYLSGSQTSKTVGEVELRTIRLSAVPDFTPPTFKLSGVRSGSVIDVDAPPVSVTAHDNIGLQLALEVCIAPRLEDMDVSWMSLGDSVEYTEGQWGINHYTISTSLPVYPGVNYVQFRVLDLAGNATQSPIMKVYGTIPAYERGTWLGSVSSTDHAGLAGMLQFVADPQGRILSGVFRYMEPGAAGVGDNDGAYRRIPFTGGAFGPNHVARLHRPHQPDLLLTFQYQNNAGDQFTTYDVVLTEEGAEQSAYTGTLYRAPYRSSHPIPLEWRGRYHLSLQPSEDGSNPYGSGYGTLTSTASGLAAFSLRMGDGSVVTGTTHLGTASQLTFLSPAYGGKGSLLLQGDVSTFVGSDVNVTGLWHRPASVASATWLAGIHRNIDGGAHVYRAPRSGQRIMGLDSTLPFLSVAWGPAAIGDPESEDTQTISISSRNQASNQMPDYERLRVTSINATTGEITGTVRLPGVTQPAPFRATIITGSQYGDEAVGYYLSPPPDRFTRGLAGHIYFRISIPTLDSQDYPLYTAYETYKAAGVTLGNLELGFMPEPGQEVILISNPGVDPVIGTFKGMPEGARLPVSIGGSTVGLIVSYRGGDGNDVTLTWQPGEAPTQLRHVFHDEGSKYAYNTGLGQTTVSTGNLLISSLPWDDTRGTTSGRVVIYNATTGALLHTLFPPPGVNHGRFGAALAVSGSRLAVSVPDYAQFAPGSTTTYTERGLVLLYDLAPDGAPALNSTLHHPAPNDGTVFGQGIALGGNFLAVGSVDATLGTTPVATERAYVYDVSDESGPRLEHTFTPPYPGTSTSGFGLHLAVTARHLAVSHLDVVTFDLTQAYSPAVFHGPTYQPHGDPIAMSGTRLLVSNFNTNTGIGSYIIDLNGTPDDPRVYHLPTAFPSDPDPNYGTMAATIVGNRVALVVSPPDRVGNYLFSPARVATYDISRLTAPRRLTATDVALTSLASLGYQPPNHVFPVSVALSGNRVAVGIEAQLYEYGPYETGITMFDTSQPGPRRLRKLLTLPVKTTERAFTGGDSSQQPFALTGGRLSVQCSSERHVLSFDLTSRTPTVQTHVFYSADAAILAGSGRYLLINPLGTQFHAPIYDLATYAQPVGYLGWGENQHRSCAMSGYRFVGGVYPQSSFGWEGRVNIYDRYPGYVSHVLEDPAFGVNPNFGSVVEFKGSLIAVGDGDTVWIFRLGSQPIEPPTLLHTIQAPAAAANGKFGTSISFSGDYLAIGAPTTEISGITCGAVYLYYLDPGYPTPTVPYRRLQAPVPVNGQRFGHSIAFDGYRLIVGAPGDTPVLPNVPPGTKTGSAFLFSQLGPTQDIPIATYLPDLDPQRLVDDIAFGTHVALSADFLAISAPEDDRDGWNNGALYIYGPPAATK